MHDVPEAVDPEVYLYWAHLAGRVQDMGLRDHVFRVELEHTLRADGGTDGWYTLAGERRGPFADQVALEADLLGWNTRARELGGWAWRRSHLELVVTLPEDVPVEGARPVDRRC